MTAKRLIAFIVAIAFMTVLPGSFLLPGSVALADGSLCQEGKDRQAEEFQRVLKEYDCYDLKVIAAPSPKDNPIPAIFVRATEDDSGLDLSGQSAYGQQMGAAVVAYAKKFLGRPYRYGASGPRAFDCSGFTRYVYKHFGVALPHNAKAQSRMNRGMKIVSKSKLMPGDLIFFHGSNGVIGHVAIYIGGGKLIEAPQSGKVVRITSLSKKKNWSFGRRIFL